MTSVLLEVRTVCSELTYSWFCDKKDLARERGWDCGSDRDVVVPAVSSTKAVSDGAVRGVAAGLLVGEAVGDGHGAGDIGGDGL